jgi:hypothetical protein
MSAPQFLRDKVRNAVDELIYDYCTAETPEDQMQVLETAQSLIRDYVDIAYESGTIAGATEASR